MYYLYVKEHNETKLKYLGQTIRDPYQYKGSGTYWKRHLRKYGNNVTTTILLTTDVYEELVESGLHYSKQFDVVESKDWANLKEENGSGGFDHINNKENKQLYVAKTANTVANWSDEKRLKVTESKINKGSKNGMFGSSRKGELNPRWGAVLTEDTKQKISKANLGKKRTQEQKEGMSERSKKMWDDPERRKARSEQYKKSGHRPVPPKGMLWWKKDNKQQRSKTCPGDGWIRGRLTDCSTKGMLWWKKDNKLQRSKTCPGDGWIRGLSRGLSL